MEVKMKTDLRIIKTQESLRNALLTLLKKKPLESINIAELCRHANINRGTFYLHYRDVHGVVESYFEEIVEDLRVSYEEPYYQTNFHIQELEADMIKIFHHIKRYENFYRIMFDGSTPIKYYYKLFSVVRSLMLNSFSEIKDEFPPEQLEFLASYQTNAIMGILIEWSQKDFSTPVNELNTYLLSFSKLID